MTRNNNFFKNFIRQWVKEKKDSEKYKYTMSSFDGEHELFFDGYYTSENRVRREAQYNSTFRKKYLIFVYCNKKMIAIYSGGKEIK